MAPEVLQNEPSNEKSLETSSKQEILPSYGWRVGVTSLLPIEQVIHKRKEGKENVIISSPINVSLSPTKTIIGKPIPTKIARFSSRGPNSLAPAILKPDIDAPRVQILARISPGKSSPNMLQPFIFLLGTSMAAPHVGGIVALLKLLHPDWSPAMIKSAIVTTGQLSGVMDDRGKYIYISQEEMKAVADYIKQQGRVSISHLVGQSN